MPTPFLVETGPTFVGDGPTDVLAQNSDNGPWEFGGNRFIAIQEIRLSDFVAFACFRKTADGTVANAFGPKLDFANAPVADYFSCYQRPGENTISFMTFANVGFGVYDFVGLGVFDLTTETYTSFVNFSNIPDTVISPEALVKFSDGSYGIFYRDVIGGNTNTLFYITCTAAGVLGVPVTVATGPFNAPANTNIIGFYDPPIPGGWPDNPLQDLIESFLTVVSIAVDSRDMVHFTVSRSIYAPPQQTSPGQFYYFNILGTVLSAATTIFAAYRTGGARLDFSGASNLRGFFSSTQNRVFLPAAIPAGPPTVDTVITAGSWVTGGFGIVVLDSATGTPVLSLDPIPTAAIFPLTGFVDFPCFWTNMAGTVYYIAIPEFLNNTFGKLYVWCRRATDVTWSGPTTWWDYTIDPPPGNPQTGNGNYTPLSIRNIEGDTALGVCLGLTDSTNQSFSGGTLYYMEGGLSPIPCTAPPPPPPVGTFVNPPTPARSSAFISYTTLSKWDGCLAWDWRVYDDICYIFRGCNKPPECILIEDGRDNWDSDFPDDATPWPSDAIVFNPQGGIPLPSPLAGDTVIMQFYVPVGYDGLILGYFHGYTLPFADGSGDLVWRLSASGRYLRDFGAVPAQMGSFVSLAPVPGGLVVHSGNLIQYIVTAPNTTGSLPVPGPQAGQIFAGVHGWFYPRK